MRLCDTMCCSATTPHGPDVETFHAASTEELKVRCSSIAAVVLGSALPDKQCPGVPTAIQV